jgi:hypothetical protein
VREPSELGAGSDSRSDTDAPFPVCVFLYTMSDDRGYYRWVNEPVLRPRGKPTLRKPSVSEWNPLNDDELAHIVKAVDSWYAAQQQPQAA